MSKARNISALNTVEVGATIDQTKSEIDALGIAATSVTGAQASAITAALPKAGGTMTGDTVHGDSVKAKFGTGGDLEIYHDASNSYIKEGGTGNLNILTSTLAVKNAAGTENVIVGVQDSYVKLYYDAVEKLATTSTGIDVTGTVTADGLGIGGTPVSKLHIRDDDSFAGADNQVVAAFSPSVTNAESAGIAFGTYSPSSYWKQGIFWKRSGSYGVGDLIFANRGTADSATVTDADAKMTITRAGNVGISTTSPAYTLHAQRSASNFIAKIENDYNSTAGHGLWVDTRYNVSANTPFQVTSNSGTSSLLRVNGVGEVLLGITSHQVSASSGIGGIFLGKPGGFIGAASSGVCMYQNRIGSSGTLTEFRINGTIAGSVYGTTGSVSYNTSSDYRLKENIVPMIGATERLKALKPSRFNFITNPERTVDGFLAHEAQEVVPECVTGSKDAMRDEEYEVTPAVYEDVITPAVGAVDATFDTDGVELTPAVEAVAESTESVVVTEAVMGTRSIPDMQGIDQSKVVPLLVATVQELLARIEALEA